MFWPNPKDVNTTDRYGVTVDSDWLGDESIVSATFTPSTASGLTVSVPVIEGNVFSAFFSDGVEGLFYVHLRITTATRSFERNLGIWVKDYSIT